jgi:peroxiredoxin
MMSNRTCRRAQRRAAEEADIRTRRSGFGRRSYSAFGAVALLLLLGLAGARAEAANWKDLTGRVAPDLVFENTAGELPAGTRLSSFRGKQVVLLVFWLRDCPHCRRELPKVQRLYELYGRSGLTVISIVHRHTPAEVAGIMTKAGWTFPVVQDLKGHLAAPYGGGRRPGFYLVGIDGRVKSSNALNDKVVLSELGKWRVHELGSMPVVLKTAEEFVRAGDYGAGLRSAEAVAKRPEADAEVQAAVERLAAIAAQKMQNRIDRAKDWAEAGDTARASEEYRAIVETFEGTSLESRAVAVREVYLRKGSGGR